MNTTYINPDGLVRALDKRRKIVNFRDTYLRNREYGFRPKYGDQSRLQCEMYSSICPIANWEYDQSSTDINDPGGIFNLDFSPDGKILAAACEQKSVMLFDPVTQKYITSIKRAHEDNVNCVKFLDSRMLATCSDDTTIAIWDVRNLNNSIKVLRGHSKWVKSIEYSAKDNLLVSSGFDGKIYTWNINCSSEEGRVPNNPICHIYGLRRIKLLPDSSKLIISTASGFILLINGLDLETLATDIQGFKPNIYRLMQLSNLTINNAASHTHMFTRKRNRVELIGDFPRCDAAKIISSIQVHPEGWNVISRNVTADEQYEWTCVHDIQDIDCPQEMGEPRVQSSEEANSLEHSLNNDLMDGRKHLHLHVKLLRMLNSVNNTPFVVLGGSRGSRQAARRNPVMNASMEIIRKYYYLLGEVRDLGTNSGVRNVASANSLQELVEALAVESSNCVDRYQVPSDQKIHKNFNRLTHYIQEANVARDFIKELCYSNDGRIICSPYRHGLRLLSFSPKCDELSTLIPKSPAVRLHELDKIVSHENTVLCTKFSPILPLLVSGCLAGRIVWYQPRI